MRRSVSIIVLLCTVFLPAAGQELSDRYAAYGTLMIERLSTAPFPHPLRANGHVYGKKSYPSEIHYQDSSVLLFIPKGFDPGKRTDLVIYFHGWYNSIDSALPQFRLIEQFAESKKNAVFLFPQGPKHAPDSFGGKLEEKEGLALFVAEAVRVLRKKYPALSPTIGNIVLAGHSGAYRVIAYCLLRGGLTENISDVILFDALYGDTEKFAYWIDHYNGRLINIYTNNGGTKAESENLMECLVSWKIPFVQFPEKESMPEQLQNHRVIFLHSDLGHNGVIAERNQFREFLQLRRAGK